MSLRPLTVYNVHHYQMAEIYLSTAYYSAFG